MSSHAAEALLIGAAGALAFLALAVVMYGVAEKLSRFGYWLSEKLGVRQEVLFLPALALSVVSVVSFWVAGWKMAGGIALVGVIIAGMSDPRFNSHRTRRDSDGV